jgi:pheromone shutdown protein TraB
MTKETIKIGGKKVIIVGTVHISKESVEEVREVIESEKPDVVGVELCQICPYFRQSSFFEVFLSGQIQYYSCC